MAERYDNRKKEVGFELNLLRSVSSFSGGTINPNTGVVSKGLWGGVNLTLLFMHSWNLIGVEENFNRARGNIFAGIGGTYTSGFLGALVRGGYEWRLAKHWAVHGSLGFRPEATALLGGTQKAISGVEFGLGVSALF